jgi:lipopolysaccharide export system permease protein
MKAAGISAHQIVAPLVLASLADSAPTFVYQERIVTRATTTLNRWQSVDYGPLPRDSGAMTNVWVRHGDDLILARTVSGRGAGTRLGNVSVYDRTGGTLVSIIEAKSARPAEGGWLLQDVDAFDVGATADRKLPTLLIAKGVEPGKFTLAQVKADEQDFRTLERSIADLKGAGRPTGPLEASLWHKLSGPLSTVLMPLLAAVAAFGLARAGQLFLRAVFGMALGFAYFVADSFSLAMGNFGAYSPMLAAWAPFALFLLIGETVLIRTEE